MNVRTIVHRSNQPIASPRFTTRPTLEPIEARLLLSAELVGDINQTSPGSDPQQLVRLGDAVYFVASSASGLKRFWRTDGTSSGTTVPRRLACG